MKTTLIAAAAACAALAAPAMAHAQTQWYGDIGYTNVSVDEVDVNLGVYQGRLGAMFTPNFGVEGEVGFSAGSDTTTVFGPAVDVELKSVVAGYVVMNWPLSESTDLYVRAGYATMEVEASTGGGSGSASASDSTVGFGARHYFTAKDGVRVDWTNYGGSDSFSIAYTRKF